MRWVFLLLIICNGIFFVWHAYLQPVEQAEPAVAAPAVAGSESLRLLDETVSGAAGPQTAPNTGPVQALPAQVEVPETCWQIGPFHDEVSAKLVKSRMKSMGIELNFIEFDVPGKPDYWVHIPPQPSRKLAIKLLRELQARKIDSFIITEGDLENGVSLGFFTEKPRADSVFEQRKAQGFDVVVREVPRVQKELWGTYSVADHGELTSALWEKIAQGYTGLERRKNYCDKIASPHDID